MDLLSQRPSVAVNTVAPDVIDTLLVGVPLADPVLRRRVEGMTGLNRLGTAAEIAAVIVWLLSPQASHMHGATIFADAGMVMH